MPKTRGETGTELDEAWGAWIAEQGEWHVFGSLTYDPRRRPHDHRWPYLDRQATGSECLDHARRWINEAKHREPRIEAAVIALEWQKSGAPHLHPLIRVAGGLYGNEFATIGQVWYERHGYAHLEQPRDQLAVSAYASKYLTKQLSDGDIVLWPSRGPMTTHQSGLLARPGGRSPRPTPYLNKERPSVIDRSSSARVLP